MHRELVERMLDAGHERANFAIVAAGRERGEPAPRARRRGSSPTARSCCATSAARCTATAPTSRACSSSGSRRPRSATPTPCSSRPRRPAVRAAEVGTPCEAVDAAARAVIAGAGLGDRFVHRTGHGIGMEAHEDPYMVAGNAAAARAGTRVQRRARRLLARAVRSPPRRHRRRHHRRPAAPQRRGARSRRRRLTPTPAVRLELSTVLLQWAAGGLLFGWVTTRRREVGLGYGWLLRGATACSRRSVWSPVSPTTTPVPVRRSATSSVSR